MSSLLSITATSVASIIPTTFSSIYRTKAPSPTTPPQPEQTFDLSSFLSELGDATETYYLPWVTDIPTYSSSSSDNSTSNPPRVPSWAVGLITTASLLLALILFMLWRKHLARKNMKSYQIHLATEPHLTFEEFRKREMEQAQRARDQGVHAAGTELSATFAELGERPEARISNIGQRRALRMKAKNWKSNVKGKGMGKGKETGDIRLMDSNEGEGSVVRYEGEGSGLRYDEESAPPPYSSVASEEDPFMGPLGRR